MELEGSIGQVETALKQSKVSIQFKLREKQLLLAIHKKNQENSAMEVEIEKNRKYILNQKEDNSLDLLQNLALNNEFNAFMNQAIEKEKAVEELNLQVFLKNLDMIESISGNMKENDINDRVINIDKKNKEFLPLIEKDCIQNKINEIKQLNKLIEEMRKELQENNDQIKSMEKEEKEQIDSYSAYLRIYKEQKQKNEVLQAQIAQLK